MVFLLSLFTRPFRLIGLIVTVGLIVGGIWLWNRAHSSTPVSEERALADFRGRAAEEPARVRPGVPRAGVYSYRVQGRETAKAGPASIGRDLPGRASYVVTPTPAGYEEEWRLSEEHIEAFRYRVAPGGARTVWTRTKLTFLGFGRDDRRDLRPPPLRMPLRPRVGQTWRSSYMAGDLPVMVAARVLRREPVRVGGRPVPALVVHVHSETGGAHPGTRDERVWWAPSLALALRMEVDMEVRGTFGLSGEARLELESTDPRT